jgi:hypothetical protein
LIDCCNLSRLDFLNPHAGTAAKMCSVKNCSRAASKAFKLERRAQHTYIVRANSEEAAQNWLTVVSGAVHKIQVASLCLPLAMIAMIGRQYETTATATR